MNSDPGGARGQDIMWIKAIGGGTETATTTNITHTRMATMQSDNEMSVRYPHCRNQETRLTREMSG
jgi:hypothetical protein